jgi:hypothetical protein
MNYITATAAFSAGTTKLPGGGVASIGGGEADFD